MRSEIVIQIARFSGTENAFKMNELLSQAQFTIFSNHLEEKEELFSMERSEMLYGK
jgi:hypothetical protein